MMMKTDANFNFYITHGMLIYELAKLKNKSYSDIFSIVGPRSIFNEIVQGKRLLNSQQIAKICHLFEVDESIFNSEQAAVIEKNHPNSMSSFDQEEKLPFDQNLMRSNYEEMENIQKPDFAFSNDQEDVNFNEKW
ncbi:MAG: hypothetical protein DCC88_04460 [Spirobacillus cienkowskii]|jgi:hypothetical protein|uniref:Uncharacterized protein n=1 Tax=Spirobacillus cienkowskii TaxID=495820 RepID=A0A369KXU3_9BACT|nr:MAG: hypothetical protein DCC88_04460 [Spirobacillus cienkowskii]